MYEKIAFDDDLYRTWEVALVSTMPELWPPSPMPANDSFFFTVEGALTPASPAATRSRSPRTLHKGLVTTLFFSNQADEERVV